MAQTRVRRVGSYKLELLLKSREAMLSAVAIYNNPNIWFKSETFTILAIVAWTYFFHAYYKERCIDYHYYHIHGRRKIYDKTKYGAKKAWELERCLNDENNPLTEEATTNLRFLIGLRHEIEHQMTTRMDDAVSAKFQACCLNYDEIVNTLWGEKMRIAHYLSFSLQFSSISEPQYEQLKDIKNLPQNILSFIENFENDIDEKIFESAAYSYRMLFVPKSANTKGQADKVVEFVKSDSQEAKDLNAYHILIKEREKKKYLPSDIVEIMRNKGYSKFRMHEFTQCWKIKNAKNNSQYGVCVAEKTWYWYESFLPIVEQFCIDKNLK